MELASAIIGILGVVAAIIFGFLAFRRGQKQDDQGEAQRLTKMETTLDYISGSVSRIESNQHEQSTTVAGLSERVTRVETRIDNLEKKQKSA